jgi:hypothetical protein
MPAKVYFFLPKYDQGTGAMLPTISSFINIEDDQSCSFVDTKDGQSVLYAPGKHIEILRNVHEDDSTMTYDFTEADKEMMRHGQIAQIQNNEEVAVSGVSKKLDSTKRPTLLDNQEATRHGPR